MAIAPDIGIGGSIGTGYLCYDGTSEPTIEIIPDIMTRYSTLLSVPTTRDNKKLKQIAFIDEFTRPVT